MDVFAPTVLAGVTLKNRIIRSATHEGLGAGRAFHADQLADRYIRLAKGGAGAIITGYAGVCRHGKTWPNMLMIDDDEYITAYRGVTTAVKPYGTPLFLQLAHGGGRTDPAVTGAAAKAPTRRRYKNAPTTAAELTGEEIAAIVDSFVHAIERAKRSGFDGVQLHAAHGYLLSAFLSPALNRRTDRWGGTTDNRCRVIREIVSRARQTVGDFPILIKLSAYDFEKNGLRLDEAVRLAQFLQDASIDAIEVSCGNEEWFSVVRSPRLPVEAILAMEPTLKSASWLKKRVAALLIPRLFKTYAEIENYNVAAAAAIKANVDIPVIVVGGIRKLSDINAVIGEGKADYVSLCRPFIIEPEIVAKMQAGGQDASRCINCNHCLLGVGSAPLQCYYGRLPAPQSPP